MAFKSKLICEQMTKYKDSSENFSELPQTIQSIVLNLNIDQIVEFDLDARTSSVNSIPSDYLRLRRLVARLDDGEMVEIKLVEKSSQLPYYTTTFYKDPLSAFGIGTDFDAFFPSGNSETPILPNEESYLESLEKA